MTVIPLSAFTRVPLSGPTRERLIGLGVVSEEEIDAEPRTEAWGACLLALRPEDTVDGQPACFGSYDATAAVCDGCVWQPRCKRPRKVLPPPPPR